MHETQLSGCIALFQTDEGYYVITSSRIGTKSSDVLETPEDAWEQGMYLLQSDYKEWLNLFPGKEKANGCA